jgi:hypothetical protein
MSDTLGFCRDVLALGRAATARLWLRLAGDGHVPPPAAELREALQGRAAEMATGLEALVRSWPRDTGAPLGRIFELLDGAPDQLGLLALAAAPSLDSGVARTYEGLAARGLLTLGFLLDLASDVEAERLRLAARLGGDAPLIARGLIELDPVFGLASGAPIHVPGSVIGAFRGADVTPPAAVQDALPPGAPPTSDLSAAGIPTDLSRPLLFTGTSPWALDTLGRVLAAREQRTLWRVSPPGSDGDRAWVLSWTRLLRDAALAGALVSCDLLPEREPEPTLGARRLAVAVAAARRVPAPSVLFLPSEENLPSWTARDTSVLPLNALPLEAANLLAEARLAQEGFADAADVARRSVAPLAIAVGQVEAMVDAHRRGVLESDTPSAKVELAEALRPKLGNLVERVPRRAPWESLILPEELTNRLREMVLYRTHADRVYREWGLGRHVTGEGVAALFTGPPGTGKSLAASVIATELGIALYRVDLSRIVSKWVGETEKNLGQLFAESRSGRAVLLFDEADSLFGKRTEVKSSHDRYANLEVNFLLQKLDEFDGIAILTSNSPNAIDAAFMRRLQFRCHFDIPDVNARLALWMQHLPSTEFIWDDVDLEQIADSYDFSGGNIRNAAIRAAFLAAEDDSPITQGHLLAACITEAEELGRVVKRE